MLVEDYEYQKKRTLNERQNLKLTADQYPNLYTKIQAISIPTKMLIYQNLHIDLENSFSQLSSKMLLSISTFTLLNTHYTLIETQDVENDKIFFDDLFHSTSYLIDGSLFFGRAYIFLNIKQYMLCRVKVAPIDSFGIITNINFKKLKLKVAVLLNHDIDEGRFYNEVYINNDSKYYSMFQIINAYFQNVYIYQIKAPMETSKLQNLLMKAYLKPEIFEHDMNILNASIYYGDYFHAVSLFYDICQNHSIIAKRNIYDLEELGNIIKKELKGAKNMIDEQIEYLKDLPL